MTGGPQVILAGWEVSALSREALLAEVAIRAVRSDPLSRALVGLLLEVDDRRQFAASCVSSCSCDTMLS